MWRRIAMPQVRPATLAVGVLAFAFHWGNVIEPILYVRSQANHTLALGVRTLQVLGPTDWPLLMAGATLLTVPAVVVFLVAHRALLGEGSAVIRRVEART
jgi:multiple sugar transport system permease protein